MTTSVVTTTFVVMADADWENRGPDNCDRCAVACHTAELTDAGRGELLCAACVAAREATVLADLASTTQRAVDADAAWERNNADGSCDFEPRRAFL